MAKILSLLVLVLMFVLLIPTGLVLASQNSVPGDKTYPVKRKMEDIIVSVASVHPATLAYFRVDFSKRRLTESVALVDKGNNADDALAAQSLNDLASETRQAIEEIKKVEDVARRKYLAQQAIIDFTQRKARIEKIKTQLASRSTIIQPVVASVLPTSPPAQVIQPTPKIIYIEKENKQIIVVTATPAPTTRPTSAPTAIPTVVPVASTGGGGGSGTGAAAAAADNAGNANNAGIDEATAIANSLSTNQSQPLPTQIPPMGPPSPTRRPRCVPTADRLCPQGEIQFEGNLQDIPNSQSTSVPAPTAAPVFNSSPGGCPSNTYAQCLNSPSGGNNATCYQSGTTTPVADACIPNCGGC